MAIARAPWRPLVSALAYHRAPFQSVATSFLRLVHAATRSPSTKAKNSISKPVRRFLPEDAKRFVKPDGKLLTTRESRDFLVQYDLEPDNGRMTRLSAGSELSGLGSDFNATFAYSPKHVLHPYDLRFFEPRGHPMAPVKRAKYARKRQEQPMWIMITGVGGVSNLVRTLTQRRLTRAIYRALEKFGYGTSPGGTRAENLRGSLWITLHNPTKAAAQSPERFGRVVADALAKYCNRQQS